MKWRWWRCLPVVAALSGCAGTPPAGDGPGSAIDPEEIREAVPREEPLSRYGNPESYEVFGRRYHVLRSAQGYRERGIASWYGSKFHGRRTSSGERYDMYGMTAAHRTLPLPTWVEVTHLGSGRRALLKVNDRGPFHDDRIIDLSWAAAQKLGIAGTGTGPVEVRALSREEVRAGAARTPARRPDAVPVATGMYVQVGAFAERTNAEALRARLAPLARAPGHIVQSNGGSGTLHRLRFGPVASVDEADALVAALLRAGAAEARIVID